jgi:hypothetical protein
MDKTRTKRPRADSGSTHGRRNLVLPMPVLLTALAACDDTAPGSPGAGGGPGAPDAGVPDPGDDTEPPARRRR